MVVMSRVKWDVLLMLLGLLFLDFVCIAAFFTSTKFNLFLFLFLASGTAAGFSLLNSRQPAMTLDESGVSTSISVLFMRPYSHQLDWKEITDIKLYWFGHVLFSTTDAPDRLKYFADLNLVRGSNQENYATIRQYWEKYR